MTPLPTAATIMQGSPPAHFPPKLDWDRSPWNRWAFQHVREIVPTVEVWRGNAPVVPLARAEQDLDRLAVTSSSGAATTLINLLDETYTDGFLVLKQGRVAYERYFNGMTARSLHLSQSVAKSFAGMLAGILVARGQLDPAAPITRYLPELGATAWQGASLQQVLDMTTGVQFSEDYVDPLSEIGQLDVASGWKPVPPQADPAFVWPEHVWELILRLTKATRPHGAAFEYRSIETDVLAFAMERVTGKRLPQLLSEEIWQKMGAEESACYTVDRAGYALADGGLNATLRDYARFGQLVLEGGRDILPARWIEATRQGNHARFGEPYTQALPDGAYHNQFWIEDSTSRAIMARGVFGQMIYINWQHQLVMAKVSSWPTFVNPAFVVATLRAARSIGQALA
jgi:CubicO group peptidase (beta-lactamase class C family)